MRSISALALLGLLITLNGCGSSPPSLRIAVTTSTRDSGLLDKLLPVFEAQEGCRVEVIAQGTGAAIKLGEARDVDALIVHARKAEETFMAAGHGSRHDEFMVNYFTILGPPTDPAGIKNLSATEALQKIQESKEVFVSRGDDSGTHKKELSLWARSQIVPGGKTYLETGQGQGASIIIADEKRGYVLSDMGTYLKYRDKVDLVPLSARDDTLKNPYSVIVVKSNESGPLNSKLAVAFADFLIGKEAQQMIGAYRVGDQLLFTPTRVTLP